MTEAKRKTEARTIEKQIELDAPAGKIWQMLTDPQELARWFPLEARVEPGKGGKISLSWGPEYEGAASIEIWEPGRRLRWIESGSSQPVAVEWTIEARGGKTLLRLVQSSFAGEADGDQEFYDSTNFGWEFMLLNLRHYLEWHAGKPRLVAWPRVKVEMSREEIYKRLAGPRGIFAEGALGNIHAGESYSLHAGTGEAWSGRAVFDVPGRGFCVTVEPLNDALAWVAIEGGGPKHDVQLWFSTYGIAQGDVDALERKWSKTLAQILA
jgi:uncharacterized protein YndB with AHSA1/START domain